MTDPCDNPRYDQKIGYDKFSDTYEIYDDYGGSTISIREMRKLLKCVKATHPELLLISAPKKKREICRNCEDCPDNCTCPESTK